MNGRCVICGAVFHRQKTIRLCKHCRAASEKLSDALCGKGLPSEEEMQRMFIEFRIQSLNCTKDRRIREPIFKIDFFNEKRRCVFCGRSVSAFEKFCHKCIIEGFNNVYEFTGRSNGWDKPPRRKREAKRNFFRSKRTLLK